MCGITGYAGFSKKVSIIKAVEAIYHRGPDHSGIKYFDNVALGSTRLSIIDLSSRGNQPMFNGDKSLCIVFNGEIYNYSELREELRNKYKFKSKSDTEVVLHAYEKWGYGCLSRLDGMFSFVIYDIKKDLLFGARDRLGQKPLKYYCKSGKFVFGSEIKCILAVLDFIPPIDETAIDNFLTLQYVPTPATGFKDIYKLPPAHYFVFKNGKLTKHRYWSLEFGQKLDLTKEEWKKSIFLGLDEAVKTHLVSDVPVGAMLSGGLDSSLVVSLMSRHYKEKIDTFSIGFDDEKFDESPYAEAVSKLFHTRHHKLKLTPRDLADNYLKLGDFYDELIGDNSVLPTYLVSKLAASKVKVALTGDGGDENFAGYDRYNFVKLASFLNKSNGHVGQISSLVSDGLFNILPNKNTERLKRFTGSLNEPFYNSYLNYSCFFTQETKNNLYSNEFKNKVRLNKAYEVYGGFYDRKLDSTDNALKIDINTYLPDDLLYKTDIASMSVGLELRSPFLDHHFMEKMASMPSNMKLSNGGKKKILKEVAVQYDLLPQEIVYRKKHGFVIPQNKWFKNYLKDFLYEIILLPHMSKIFDINKLQKYLDDYYSSNLNYDNNIFALLMLSLWLNKFHSGN